jgi:hypothetical protein
MQKDEFISKWSNWWRLQKDHEVITEAFIRELETLTKPKPLEWEKANAIETRAKTPFGYYSIYSYTDLMHEAIGLGGDNVNVLGEYFNDAQQAKNACDRDYIKLFNQMIQQ